MYNRVKKMKKKKEKWVEPKLIVLVDQTKFGLNRVLQGCGGTCGFLGAPVPKS